MKPSKKSLFTLAAATTLALANSSNADPDLVRYIQDQRCTPHMKKDWSETYAAPSTDPDLVRYIQDQHVPPHMKKDWSQTHPAQSVGDSTALAYRHVGPPHGGHDVWFEIAPLK
jgi:hypothetical protein